MNSSKQTEQKNRFFVDIRPVMSWYDRGDLVQRNFDSGNISDDIIEHIKGNVFLDQTRSHLNFEIRKNKVQPIDSSKTLMDMFRDNIKARNIEEPQSFPEEFGSIIMAELVFSGDIHFIEKMVFGDQMIMYGEGVDNSQITASDNVKSWAYMCYIFTSLSFGKDNIVAFYVHLDEQVPHIHCFITPTVLDKAENKLTVSYIDRLGEHDFLSISKATFARCVEKYFPGSGSDVFELSDLYSKGGLAFFGGPTNIEDFCLDPYNVFQTLEEKYISLQSLEKELEEEIANLFVKKSSVIRKKYDLKIFTDYFCNLQFTEGSGIGL